MVKAYVLLLQTNWNSKAVISLQSDHLQNLTYFVILVHTQLWDAEAIILKIHL